MLGSLDIDGSLDKEGAKDGSLLVDGCKLTDGCELIVGEAVDLALFDLLVPDLLFFVFFVFPLLLSLPAVGTFSVFVLLFILPAVETFSAFGSYVLLLAFVGFIVGEDVGFGVSICGTSPESSVT